MASLEGTCPSPGLLKLAPLAAVAFLRRGVATYVSYRAKLVTGALSLSLSMLALGLVGKVVETAGTGFADRYGTDYASFAIVGAVVHSVASTGLNCFRAAVRREQLQGTLETLLTSRLPSSLAVFLGGLTELALVLTGGAAVLAAAVLVLGVDASPEPAALGAFALYAAFMVGLGLASAGFVLVSKEGEPVTWLLAAVTGLLGGVYFPVDLLPEWLSGVSRMLPTTHALALVRASIAGRGETGATLSMVVLACQAATSIAAGLIALRWGARYARRLGTIGEY